MAHTADTHRDRFQGCLLGGAAGDALGYGIEFWGESQIFGEFGPDGIATLEQAKSLSYSGVAHFSDDTQMTLFTANGLTYGLERTSGMTAPDASDIFLAYREWLGTQGDTSRMDDPKHPHMWLYGARTLHALRAPGNTCLSATRHSAQGGTPDRPVNNSCGCGGVMRVAPVGLLATLRRDVDALQLGAEAAALTHGHPQGWLPAALLARIVELACMLDDFATVVDPHSALCLVVEQAQKDMVTRFADVPEAQELCDLIQEAMRLSEDQGASRKEEVARIHQLGEGWVGHEALAIAVYAALAHADDFAAAMRCAVNHKGDSDSTGAIAGNILGALWGRKALEEQYDLTYLEGVDLLVRVADGLFDAPRSPLGMDA